MKKFILRAVSLLLIFSLCVPIASASAISTSCNACADTEATGTAVATTGKERIDGFMIDVDSRYGSVPTDLWAWSSGVYTGNFQYHSYTYSNYYFKPNSSNKIYYSITGEFGMVTAKITVESYCLTCSKEKLTEFEFTPVASTEYNAHRVVDVTSSHAGHNIYFKLLNASGIIYFTGKMQISDSYV